MPRRRRSRATGRASPAISGVHGRGARRSRPSGRSRARKPSRRVPRARVVTVIMQPQGIAEARGSGVVSKACRVSRHHVSVAIDPHAERRRASRHKGRSRGPQSRIETSRTLGSTVDSSNNPRRILEIGQHARDRRLAITARRRAKPDGHFARRRLRSWSCRAGGPKNRRGRARAAASRRMNTDRFSPQNVPERNSRATEDAAPRRCLGIARRGENESGRSPAFA